MSSVTEVIQSRAEQIMQLWSVRAAQTASAKGLSRPELQNILPKYLRALADVDEGAAHRRRRFLESHLSARLRQGFVLPEIIEEILLLGSCVAEVCRGVSADERPNAAEMEPLVLELNQAAAAVSLMFTEYLLEDEQGERAFLRRIQGIAAEARGAEGNGTPPLLERLADVLSVVTEAVGADGAAVLFPEGDGAAVMASVGTLAEPTGRAATDARPLFQLVAATTNASVLIEDVATSTVQLPAQLRQSGMQNPVTLAGSRLPFEGSLSGVMYVIRTGPPFSTRQVRRFEALGHLLSALLERAPVRGTPRQDRRARRRTAGPRLARLGDGARPALAVDDGPRDRDAHREASRERPAPPAARGLHQEQRRANERDPWRSPRRKPRQGRDAAHAQARAMRSGRRRPGRVGRARGGVR